MSRVEWYVSTLRSTFFFFRRRDSPRRFRLTWIFVRFLRTPIYRIFWFLFLCVKSIVLVATFFFSPRTIFSSAPLVESYLRGLGIVDEEKAIKDKTHLKCVDHFLPDLRKSQLRNFEFGIPFKRNLRLKARVEQEIGDSGTSAFVLRANVMVIVGPPRVGSTFLHTLLGLDERRNRTIKAWEFRHPNLEERVGASTENEARTAKELDFFYKLTPRMRSVHLVKASQPDECVLGFFDTPTIDLSAWGCVDFSASYRWFVETSQRGVYSNYVKFLSVLTRNESEEKRNLVLKSPHHTLKLPEVIDSFGRDSRLIWLHRDPVEVVTSCLNMNLCVLDYVSAYYVDPDALGRRTLDRLAAAVRKASKERVGALKHARFVDVSYKNLIRDPHACVRALYEECGVDVDDDDEFFARILPTHLEESKKQREEHKRNSGGNLNSDRKPLEFFGLSRSDVASAFAEYAKEYAEYL